MRAVARGNTPQRSAHSAQPEISGKFGHSVLGSLHTKESQIIEPESNPRVFTIAEVDALIPELSNRIETQLALQSDIEKLLGQLVDHLGELPDTIVPDEDEPEAVYTLKSELADYIADYEAGWRDVQSMGAVVKDPQTGLLDFYGRIEGRLVWLCWKFGEERLGYYHELDAGFSGRRALGAELRGRLLN